MVDDHVDDLGIECLTRSDIASMLKISTKQAGRLMDGMPTFRVGRAHRRVLRADFVSWLIARREAEALRRPSCLRPIIVIAAKRRARSVKLGSGSVAVAAQKLMERMARVKP